MLNCDFAISNVIYFRYNKERFVPVSIIDRSYHDLG
jgi:hypothetical protein